MVLHQILKKLVLEIIVYVKIFNKYSIYCLNINEIHIIIYNIIEYDVLFL